MYQINTLHFLNLYNIVCQLYFNTKKKKNPTRPCLPLFPPTTVSPTQTLTGWAHQPPPAHLKVFDGHSWIREETLTEGNLDSSLLNPFLQVVQSLGRR